MPTHESEDKGYAAEKLTVHIVVGCMYLHLQDGHAMHLKHYAKLSVCLGSTWRRACKHFV